MSRVARRLEVGAVNINNVVVNFFEFAGPQCVRGCSRRAWRWV
jgi:hypothetical protein